MATLKLQYANANLLASYLKSTYQPNSRHVVMQRLLDLMGQIGSGTVRSGPGGATLVSTVIDDQTQAAGTVTCASASAADTVTVGNIVFTAVSGTPSGNQFKVGVSNTADGLSLATAINANTSLNPFLAAVNASGAVTLTTIGLGNGGNLLALASSNNTRLAVVGFTGGAADSNAMTYNF